MAGAVQKALQSVAQSTGWTYSLLWRLCPRQNALVWAGGHYNGAIRTRKTTVHHHHRQPAAGEQGADEEEETAAGRAALRRSRQLKELYDSLMAAGEAADGSDWAATGGGAQQQNKKVVVVTPPPLAPEDLTETEWFYLMLPGEAFVKRVHVWLGGANKVDSEVFLRAILARSAGIQTVACIPVDDGVLEIGTTEKVEEDFGLVQYAKSIFMDQIGAHIMLPTLSGHSSSTPTTHINHQSLQTKMENYIGDINVQKTSLNPGEEHNDEMEDDDNRNDLEIDNTKNDSFRHSPRYVNKAGNENEMLNAGSSELMMIGTSGRVRDGCSNQEDEVIPVLMVGQNNGNLAAKDELGPWQHCFNEGLSSKYLQPSAAEDQAVRAENAHHYVETVLAILRLNACQQMQAASTSNTKTYLALSKNSSFSRWTRWSHKESNNNDLHKSMLIPEEGTPQRMLKSILIGAPSSSRHRSYRGGDIVQSPEPRDDGEGASRSRRGPVPVPVQEAELSTSHVQERQRREKLNERFVMLRSLVPYVTKMDRASILGDTIEYVRQLRRRIHELESPPPAASTETKRCRHHHRHTHTSGGYLWHVGGTAAEASGSCCDDTNSGSVVGEPAVAAAAAAAVAGETALEEVVEVSIIGSDALVELRCPHREGLLLRVMLALHQELRLEVTSVQASSAGDVLRAQLRAKVKEVHGRRSSITEVKRAIHLIVSSSD